MKIPHIWAMPRPYGSQAGQKPAGGLDHVKYKARLSLTQIDLHQLKPKDRFILARKLMYRNNIK